MMFSGMFLVWLIPLALLVVGGMWLFNNGANRSGDGNAATGSALPAQKTPLDILKERYARGEIDRNQFEEMRQNLIG